MVSAYLTCFLPRGLGKAERYADRTMHKIFVRIRNNMVDLGTGRHCFRFIRQALTHFLIPEMCSLAEARNMLPVESSSMVSSKTSKLMNSSGKYRIDADGRDFTKAISTNYIYIFWEFVSDAKVPQHVQLQQRNTLLVGSKYIIVTQVSDACCILLVGHSD